MSKAMALKPLPAEDVQEKPSFTDTPSSPLSDLDASDADMKRLLWKLDMRVLPPLFILWFLSFVDRINIGMARLGGMEKDLGMQGNEFNIAMIVFFPPFILMEVPANMVLKKMSPGIWLPLQNFVLAIFTIGQGVVKTKEGLYAMRFFVGFCEAGLVPGSLFLLSAYYARFDLQWRMNVLIVGNSVASAFGGLLAYAISGLSGEMGYLGWRWIFIIEGSITAVVSLLCVVFVVNWPKDAKWLSDKERDMISTRIASQAGTYRMDRLDKSTIKRIAKDWKMWLNVAIYIATIGNLYCVSLFSPTIVAELNPSYTGRHDQVLCIPIFLAAGISALLTALISDRLQHRYCFAMLGYAITLIGWIIYLCQNHVPVGAKYLALFFVNVGAYVSLPLVYSTVINNVSGFWKTSIASSVTIGFGQAGGLIASCLFVKTAAPHYWAGFRTQFGLTVFAMLALSGYVIGLWTENRKREKGGRDYRFMLSGEEQNNLGDDHPDFRFVY